MILEKKLPNQVGQHVLAVTGLLLLVALRFLPTFTNGLLYGPFRDNVFIYGPMFSETARIALHGEIPFYLPSFAAGFPLFESPHYSPFYPFYFFGLLDYGGPLQSLYTLTYLTILHRFILALNFFVMLCCARVSPWAAFTGASIGVLASNTELYSGWITITATYTWMPLLVAGGILLIRNSNRGVGIILVGVSAAMLALASTSQSIAHAIFFCLILFGAGAVWILVNHGLRSALQFLISLLAAAGIAFGLGAVSAVPVYLGMEGMIRHIGNGFVLGHQHIPWEKFNGSQLALKDAAGILVNPDAVNVVGSPYVGPLGVLGVVFAILSFGSLDKIDRFLVAVIGGIGLYALLSAFGTNLGFAYLNYHLPLINHLREAGRHLALFVIAVVFLAGVGFDKLGTHLTEYKVTENISRRAWTTAMILTVAFLLVVTLEVSKHGHFAHGGAVVLLLGPGLASIGLPFRVKPVSLFVVSAVFVSIASTISTVRTLDIKESEFIHPENRHSLEILSAVRSKVGSGDFRIDFEDKKFNVFTWGMNASYFGFNSFYNRLTPQSYDQFRFSVRRNPRYLRAMMGARYVLCNAEEKPTDPGAEIRFEVEGYRLFENPAYMGRMTLVHGLAGTFSSESEFISRAARGFDFRHNAYVKDTDAKRFAPFLRANPQGSGATEDRISVTENSVNRAAALVESTQSGVFVLNEWFIGAWHAKVNGVTKAVSRINQWQVGVPVPTGRNVVEFIYRPSTSWKLLILNRVTWIILTLCVLVGLFRRFRLRWRNLPSLV